MIEDKLKRLLDEDLWQIDITSEALIDYGTRVQGEIICKQDCIVAGLQEVAALFEMYDCHVESLVKDGER
ncbi:MAG: carboxylating.nicotinate-nucleotide diphosphorylase, partial [Thaumarchaeota archaeon]|nr:carboxylating.nicotinate-nucleotide diphosphorylase [Nitrososphaerota archaeon]